MRISPESTTTRTPSMVRLVSAMEVASTTLRRPGGLGRMAWSCACCGRLPKSGWMRTPRGSPSADSISSTRRISPAPGRKTSTSPSSVSSAARTARAAAASMRPSGRRGSQRVSTGCTRPSLVTTGAASSSAATGPPASVALITSTRRSSRSTARDCSVSARPRSACRERSWNSSKITIPTPSSAGSCCSIRVSTPSVTTSTRVDGPTRVSMRMR